MPGNQTNSAAVPLCQMLVTVMGWSFPFYSVALRFVAVVVFAFKIHKTHSKDTAT